MYTHLRMYTHTRAHTHTPASPRARTRAHPHTHPHTQASAVLQTDILEELIREGAVLSPSTMTNLRADKAATTVGRGSGPSEPPIGECRAVGMLRPSDIRQTDGVSAISERQLAERQWERRVMHTRI